MQLLLSLVPAPASQLSVSAAQAVTHEFWLSAGDSETVGVCVCVSGFISRYDTELAEYDYCSDGSSGGGGGGRMISAAAAAAAAAVTPVSSSRQ
jgi:hypothetical protein